MKVYEIDSELEFLEVLLNAYEPESADYIEAQQKLEDVKIEKDLKVSACGRVVKNLMASIKAHEDEVRVLNARKKRLKNDLEFVKGLIELLLNRNNEFENFEDGAIKISWRKAVDELEFEESKLPDEFKKIEVTPKLSEMRKFIKENGRQEWGDLNINQKKNIWIR